MKLALSLSACVLLVAGCGKVHADKVKRFVPIDEQVVPPAILDSDGSGLTFRVIRDVETGQEIVCAEGPINRWNRVASCWLTGRKW